MLIKAAPSPLDWDRSWPRLLVIATTYCFFRIGRNAGPEKKKKKKFVEADRPADHRINLSYPVQWILFIYLFWGTVEGCIRLTHISLSLARAEEDLKLMANHQRMQKIIDVRSVYLGSDQSINRLAEESSSCPSLST